MKHIRAVYCLDSLCPPSPTHLFRSTSASPLVNMLATSAHLRSVRVSLRSVAPAHSWLPRLDRQSPLARFSCELPTPEVRRAGLKGGDLLIERVVWGFLSSTRGEGAGAVEEGPGVTRAVAKPSKTVGISIGGGSACSRGIAEVALATFWFQGALGAYFLIRNGCPKCFCSVQSVPIGGKNAVFQSQTAP